MKSLHRDPSVLGARIMLTAFMAILSGMIFWQIGGTDPSDRTVRDMQHLAILKRVRWCSHTGIAYKPMASAPPS